MKAKLIIWDLDDTLWKGTLAEGTSLVVDERRTAIIRELNRRGVVNAICSKNDREVARRTLEERGLWDEFVFSEIAFSPKGPMVKRIITDMQLRAPDVVFIDNEPMNLKEVEYDNPGIRVLNALDPETDKLLQAMLDGLAGVEKSRVEEYRQLERKRADATAMGSSSSNENFLATCDIHVCLLRKTDNLPFATRIEELINRTNQLNFTKSRVPDGSMPEYLIDPAHETYSVLVWDKYGFYGLVGFAAIEGKSQLVHFTFSCRVMNMGIEASVVRTLGKKFPDVKFPLEPMKTPWITYVAPDSEIFRSRIASEEKGSQEIQYRVMSLCQSGALYHYMGMPGGEWDNWPRIFNLQNIMRDDLGGYDLQLRPVMIYGAYGDYEDRYWDAPPTLDLYESACERFVDLVRGAGSHALIILPIDDFQKTYKNGVTRERFVAFNGVWRRLAAKQESIELIEFGALIEPGDESGKDPRHYSPALLARAGAELARLTKRITLGRRKMIDASVLQVAE